MTVSDFLITVSFFSLGFTPVLIPSVSVHTSNEKCPGGDQNLVVIEI